MEHRAPEAAAIAKPPEGAPDRLSDGARFDRLLEHMPIALWEVDATEPGKIFERLRNDGLADIAAYLGERPDLIDHASDTVMVTRVNRAAVRLLGGTDESQFIRPVRYLFEVAPDAVLRVMVAHYERRRTHIEELKIRTFDGQTVDVVLLVTYPQPPERMDLTFIIMLEITDRRRAEAEVRQLEADLAHAARVATLGELATSIAHEVKQPLGAIVMNAETSLRWLAEPDPNLAKARMLIERMVECADQASETIGRVQSMASKRLPAFTAVSLNEVVDVALKFVRHDSRQKEVAIRLRLAADLADMLGDRIQLQQVIVNLLINAVQAIDQNPAIGPREILVETRNADLGHVEISVLDSGPGIGPADMDRLFEGFFSTKPSGMGMGLTICQSIVRGHFGKILVENRPAGGAIFRCRFPVNGADAGAAGASTLV
jgi:C4-dicarboxylate-specific signal transduction histidine kinase